MNSQTFQEETKESPALANLKVDDNEELKLEQKDKMLLSLDERIKRYELKKETVAASSLVYSADEKPEII